MCGLIAGWRIEIRDTQDFQNKNTIKTLFLEYMDSWLVITQSPSPEQENRHSFIT